MSQGARRLRKVALSALHYSGADSVIAPFTRGVGAILTLASRARRASLARSSPTATSR